MRTARPLLSVAFGVAAIAAAPAIAAEDMQKSAQGEPEKPVQLSQVPAAARKAAEKELGAQPSDAAEINLSGRKTYELMAKDRLGTPRAVHVSPDGKVLNDELD